MRYREFMAMHGYKLIKKIENEAILKGFKSPEVRKKIKTRKISILGFQCVAMSKVILKFWLLLGFIAKFG